MKSKFPVYIICSLIQITLGAGVRFSAVMADGSLLSDQQGNESLLPPKSLK